MGQEGEQSFVSPDAPRRRTELVGHAEAEKHLLRAYQSGRMHQGWILAGRRGIGKATLAFRLARFVLQYPDGSSASECTSLFVDGKTSVARQVGSGSHVDLLVLERPWDDKQKRPKSEISVDVAREASSFFSRTAGAGGWRICVVDSADDLNSESANSLLKILEEPPPRSLFLLISHRPGALLPTIRSRCLRLDLKPLSEDQTESVVRQISGISGADEIRRAARLSGGSPGQALTLLESQGAAAFEELLQFLNMPDRLDLGRRVEIADRFSGRSAARDFEIFCDLLQSWTGEEARRRAGSARGGALARAFQETGHSLRVTDALNLDRRQAVLDALDILESALKVA